MSVNWIGLNRQVKYLTVKLLQYSERSARLDIKPTENYSILIRFAHSVHSAVR